MLKNFLHYIVSNSRRKKWGENDLLTEWKYLQTLYRKQFGKRFDSSISFVITKYVKAGANGKLAKKGMVHFEKRKKDPFTGKDLYNLLYHHWCQDAGAFTHERYRVQAALLAQLMAYTAARPVSILSSEMYTESLLYEVVTTK